MESVRTVITGTGSYIPSYIKFNKDFAAHRFYGEDSIQIETPPDIVVEKFRQITGISERRYASVEVNTSGMAAEAARVALDDAACDPETIDQLIVAHNFGNVVSETIQSDAVPSLASRVKHALGIKNPYCIPYDVLFGCPGWLQGVIQADAFFKAGIAKKCLVIGSETLSRVIDIHDRDSMIFSDGAGACILESQNGKGSNGILSTAVQSHSREEVDYITMGMSYFPEADPKVRYIKMKGRKVYEYAVTYVPAAMKECIDKAGIAIKDLKKIFIHQANEKMDEGIIKALYKLYGEPAPEYIMPMSIHNLGNSSVATIPTLLDLVRRNKMQDHTLQQGDVILFASVGAGMNINAVCYRI